MARHCPNCGACIKCTGAKDKTLPDGKPGCTFCYNHYVPKQETSVDGKAPVINQVTRRSSKV